MNLGIKELYYKDTAKTTQETLSAISNPLQGISQFSSANSNKNED